MKKEYCRILNNHYEGIFKLIELQSVRACYILNIRTGPNKVGYLGLLQPFDNYWTYTLVSHIVFHTHSFIRIL